MTPGREVGPLDPAEVVMPAENDDCLIDGEANEARSFVAYLDSQVTLSFPAEGAPAELAAYLDVLRAAAAACDPGGRGVEVTISRWAATCEGAYGIVDIRPDGGLTVSFCGCAFVDDSVAVCRPAPESWQRLAAQGWVWQGGELSVWWRAWPPETPELDVAQATLLGLFAAFGLVESAGVYLEATLELGGQRHAVDLRGRVAVLAGLGERPRVRVPAWTETAFQAREHGLGERVLEARSRHADQNASSSNV